MAGRSLRGAADTRAFHEWARRVAGNVRRLRAARAWSQEEAAHRCAMASRLFQAIEAGDANLTLATLSRLTAGFAVDPIELVTQVSAPMPMLRRGRPKRAASSAS